MSMRFNGAVTFSLRKYPDPPREDVTHPGFNGAVTFSLRKFAWPAGEKRTNHGCFNGAVTFSLRKYIVSHFISSSISLLQWGRNFFVTEIGTMSRTTYQDCVLQWGRNFFVTEMQERGSYNDAGHNRFNGAVTFSLRKFG